MSEQFAAQRARVIAAAREWLGTPFHHAAQVKGVGVDCVHLVAAVYEAAGLTGKVEIEPYSVQVMLHRDDETVIRYLTRYGREVEAPGAGDVVLYRVGKSYSHAGIVVAWPTIIHAHSLSGKVVEMDGRVADLARCLRAAPPRFFSPW
jgi:cell wall-associated NlpC family hydrolase